MTDEMQKKIFGNNLSYYVDKRRRTTGQGQKDIAADLGIASSTFNNWCNGKSMAPVSKVQQLADYFGIKKSDLLDEHTESGHYYIDEESRQMAEFLANNKDYRVLFDAMRNVRPSDIQKVIDFIETNGGSDGSGI